MIYNLFNSLYRALSERDAGIQKPVGGEQNELVARQVTCVEAEADVVASALSNIIR